MPVVAKRQATHVGHALVHRHREAPVLLAGVGQQRGQDGPPEDRRPPARSVVEGGGAEREGRETEALDVVVERHLRPRLLPSSHQMARSRLKWG